MNWKEIKKKYLKAYLLAIDWHYDIHGILIAICNIESVFNTRDLYDFFDEQGIYIGITGVFDIDYGWAFSYSIDHNDPLGNYENRKDAETDAFREVFEILKKSICGFNKKLNEFLGNFLKPFTPKSKIGFIKALKFKGISLNYGTNKYPVSIGYSEKNMDLKKEILDACKKISSKEWNDADKIDYKFKLSFINS